MKPVTSKDLLAILERVARDMEAAKDYLTELDSAVGDGDLGVTMTLGFAAVRTALPALADKDIGTILMQSGMTFNNSAASTIGVLLASALMRAGKEVRGKMEIGRGDLARMARAALAAVRERGKAELGEKTMLDSLEPAVHALSEACEGGLPAAEAVARTIAAAETGMKATIGMKAARGRATWLAERTVGHQDPGATSTFLMIKSVASYLSGPSSGQPRSTKERR